MNYNRQAALSGVYKKRAPRRALTRYAAIAILFLSEIFVAIAASIPVAVWAIPAAYRQRGYYAVGGEWLLVMFAAAISYTIYHKWLFKKLEEPEKRRIYHE